MQSISEKLPRQKVPIVIVGKTRSDGKINAAKVRKNNVKPHTKHKDSRRACRMPDATEAGAAFAGRLREEIGLSHTSN